MALTLAICSAQPNWMPRKPKLMFQICQKLSCDLWMPLALPFMSGPPLGVLGPRHNSSSRLLDEQNLSFMGTDCEMQPPICPQRAERLLLEEVRDHAAGRRGLDGHRLVHDRSAEVRGRDLSAPAVGEPVDHDDQTPGLHRRDGDLRRCASVRRRTSRIPRAAAATVAVVQATPLAAARL